jgi:Alginate export
MFQVGLLTGTWLACGFGLARAEEPAQRPPSIWAQPLPEVPPSVIQPAAAPPAALPTIVIPLRSEAIPAPQAATADTPAPIAVPQSCDQGCPHAKSVWDNVPPVHPTPRLGNYAIPPTGCGYYSALDAIVGNCRAEPPHNPYPPTGYFAGSFFDADYRYLDAPDNQQHDFFDSLKRIHLGCDWMFTTGGEVRVRYMDETDSRLTGKGNDYDLFRTRVYGDLWYRDQFRVYAEFLYADSGGQDLAPLGIDVNRSDLLNLFVDVKVGDIDGRPVYVRGGRQELLYGSERLISPLDWANTRRTFQGVKAFYQGDKLDVDAFWVQPVAVSPNGFDSVDDKLNFTGVWATYRPQKGQTLDFYALNLDRSGPSSSTQDQVPGAANTLAPTHFNITTLGSRNAGDYCGRLTWDFEGMVQVGERGSQDLFAYASTTGVGYRLADAPWTPHLWLYYDYASGDQKADKGGHYDTFNQLFPFGHYYFGYIDDVGRQNIQDLNLDLNYFPTNWITGQIQFHQFWLAQPEDALYNAGGKILRQDPTGRAGRDVGQEIDLLWNFHMTTHQDILVGYSKLFAGEFIKKTGNPESPELFYLQYTYRW